MAEEGSGGLPEKLVLVLLFFGAAYPLLRVELLDWTGLPSSVLGAWIDLLYLLMLAALLGRADRDLIVNPVTLFVWAIVFLGAISIVVGGASIQVIYGLRLTYLPMILFFVGWQLGLGRRAGNIIDTIAVVAGLSAVAGIVLTFVFPDYWISLYTREVADSRGWGLQAIEREFGLRMTGALLDPVSFGTLCAWGFSIGVNRMLVPNARKSMIRLIALALMLAGAILSLSRGAWASILIAGLITVFARPTLLLNGRALAIALALGVAAGVVATRDESADVVAVLDATLGKTLSEGNLQREDQFAGVIDNLAGHPLGYGLGNVGHVGERFSDGGVTVEGYTHITDGWYLKLVAEGGIGLFLAFVAFLGCLAWTLVAALVVERDPERRALLTAVLGIYAAASVQALVSNLWDLYFVSQILWLLAGIGAALSEQARLTFRDKVGAS